MAETKGITITFKGDTVQFDKDLQGVNKALKTLKSEMNNLNKQLKLDPKNVDLLKSKLENLKQQEKVLTEQVKLYKNELAKIPQQDIGGEKWVNLNKQLGNAEVSLMQVSDQMGKLNGYIDKLQTAPSKIEQFSKKLDEVSTKLKTIGKSLEDAGKKLSVLSGAIGALGVAGIRYNAQLEQYQVALTTLLGSAEEADRVMKQIQDDASRTPFDVDSLTQANSLLISAGIDAEQSREVILALGDAISATGGGSAELSRMAQNLQQIKNVGKATAQDIKQFANAGINIYGLLADYTGKTTEQVKDMDVSFDVLSEALKSASAEGGKYFGAMANQSQTINGLISTLKDNVSQLLGELTKSLVPTVKRIIDYVSRMVERVKGLDDGQKRLITTVGVMLTALGPTVLLIGKLVTAGGEIAGKFKEMLPLIEKMKGGITSIVSPIGIAVTAFGLLYATNEKFREAVNGLVSSLAGSLKPIIDTVTGSISTLISTLSSYLSPIIDYLVNILTTYIIPALNTLIQSVMPVLNGVLQVAFGIIQKLVEWIGKLWTYLENRGVIDAVKNAFETLGTIISDLVGWVKDLFGWFGSLIDKAKEFLGINGQIASSDVLTNGRGVAVNYGSGGFASGGLVLNTSINVTNNAGSITQAQVLSWADMMTERINENLGRMV